MLGLPMLPPHSPIVDIVNAVTTLVDMTYTAFLVSNERPSLVSSTSEDVETK